VNHHPLAAAILRSQAETVAIVAERRLAVAALTALLLKDTDYRVIVEIRGTAEVHQALELHQPVVIVEARDSSLSPADSRSLLPSSRTALVVGPSDRPEVFASSIRTAINDARTAPRSRLSEREWDILIRIASGRSTKQVARDCAISPKTVGNHVSNIGQKLNLHHRGQLVLFALQQGLTTA
jgi:DNA-binding CsgD family transcriptional regulator